jgi:hypothetical protein
MINKYVEIYVHILHSPITHIYNKHFRLQKAGCLSFRTNNGELKRIVHFCLLFSAPING